MYKNEFITAVSEKAGISKKDSETVINAVIGSITEALARGDKVQIAGFGVFETKLRAARRGRNPATGEEMEIPACNVPIFKASKILKDAVN